MDLTVTTSLRRLVAVPAVTAGLIAGGALSSVISRDAAASTAASAGVRAQQVQFTPSGPVLDVGDTGQAVADWQAALNAWRVHNARPLIVVDGIYGPVTATATSDFQRTVGIPVDGIVGQQTRDALAYIFGTAAAGPAPGPGPEPEPEPGPDAPLLHPGDTGAAVAEWQVRLNEWRNRTNRGPIAVDGVYGPNTAGATRDFQAAAGIVADGVVGPQTRAALDGALGAPAPPAPEPEPEPTAPLLRRGDSGPAVAFWQARLNEWRSRNARAPIALDAAFGPETEAATRDFQSTLEIAVDGIVGPQTRDAMTFVLGG